MLTLLLNCLFLPKLETKQFQTAVHPPPLSSVNMSSFYFCDLTEIEYVSSFYNFICVVSQIFAFPIESTYLMTRLLKLHLCSEHTCTAAC